MARQTYLALRRCFNIGNVPSGQRASQNGSVLGLNLGRPRTKLQARLSRLPNIRDTPRYSSCQAEQYIEDMV